MSQSVIAKTFLPALQDSGHEGEMGMLQQGAQSGGLGLGPAPQASESPFLSPPCPPPSCCQVLLSKFYKESHGERGVGHGP